MVGRWRTIRDEVRGIEWMYLTKMKVNKLINQLNRKQTGKPERYGAFRLSVSVIRRTQTE